MFFGDVLIFVVLVVYCVIQLLFMFYVVLCIWVVVLLYRNSVILFSCCGVINFLEGCFFVSSWVLVCFGLIFLVMCLLICCCISGVSIQSGQMVLQVMLLCVVFRVMVLVSLIIVCLVVMQVDFFFDVIRLCIEVMLMMCFQLCWCIFGSVRWVVWKMLERLMVRILFYLFIGNCFIGVMCWMLVLLIMILMLLKVFLVQCIIVLICLMLCRLVL